MNVNPMFLYNEDFKHSTYKYIIQLSKGCDPKRIFAKHIALTKRQYKNFSLLQISRTGHYN